MADHIDQVSSSDEEQSLLPIGWDDNVSILHGHCSPDTHRLFAQALHVKRKPTLSLHFHHPIVVCANSNHVPQGIAKGVGIQSRIPFADGFIVIIEDAE